MYKNKKILAVVMARGGSKGIKNKNLKKINGLPLVSIAGKLLKKINIIDRSIISTDSKKISACGKKSGLGVFFKRPKNLSKDLTSDFKVINHSLKMMEKIDNTKYEVVLLIQPTSPMRVRKDIIKCIKILVNKKASAVWTINKVDIKFHPLKQLKITNGLLNHFDKKGKKIIARQQLDSTYIRNGICYAISRNAILKEKSIMGKKCLYSIIKKTVVNIDNLSELNLARKVFKKKQ